MGQSKTNEYEITKKMLSMFENKSMIREVENDSNNGDAIAITDDAKFGEQVLTNQMNSFKQSVHGGAKFANANPSNPKSSPLNLSSSGIEATCFSTISAGTLTSCGRTFRPFAPYLPNLATLYKSGSYSFNSSSCCI